MARYIDADKLIDKIFPIGLIDDGKYTINAKAIKMAVDSCPTADVVPKSEVEALKARKICSIGDKLYIIVEDELAPGGYDIEINHVTDVGERFIFFSGYMPPREDVLENVAIEDIGKDIFLDEEAFRRELEARRCLEKTKGRNT